MVSLLLLNTETRANAKSPNPTPSPLDTSEEEKQQSGAITPNARDQNQVIRSVASTVNQRPTPFTVPPSNQNARQGGNKAPSNWWLVIFTGVLAAVGLAQFCAMTKQAEYMRRANLLTRATLKAVRKTLEVQEHAVYRVQGANLYLQRAEVIDNKRVKVIVRNTGVTQATIFSKVVEARHLREFPKAPQYRKAASYGAGLVILPNEEKAFECDIDVEVSAKYLLAYGYLVFEDIFNRRFQFGYGCLYVNTDGQFAKIPRPSFNYLRELKNEGSEA